MCLWSNFLLGLPQQPRCVIEPCGSHLHLFWISDVSQSRQSFTTGEKSLCCNALWFFSLHRGMTNKEAEVTSQAVMGDHIDTLEYTTRRDRGGFRRHFGSNTTICMRAWKDPLASGQRVHAHLRCCLPNEVFNLITRVHRAVWTWLSKAWAAGIAGCKQSATLAGLGASMKRHCQELEFLKEWSTELTPEKSDGFLQTRRGGSRVRTAFAK